MPRYRRQRGEVAPKVGRLRLADLRDKREVLQPELQAELAALETAARDEPLEPVTVKAKKAGVTMQLVGLAFEPL
jgi:hypothetical protein